MSNKSPDVDPNSVVSLREITKDTVREILRLDVTDEQKQFVAPNSVSIAQAHFEEKAWFRAVYADETPVGFVMLYDDPQAHEYFLWRFMIDSRYQGNGFGRQALELLLDYVKSRPGARELFVSHVEGEGSPAAFYRRFGFKYTGEIDGGELVMRLPLSGP